MAGYSDDDRDTTEDSDFDAKRKMRRRKLRSAMTTTIDSVEIEYKLAWG